ncbi:NAD-dependent epimerase/dehydratase family protein, partial [Streptomyces sp. NPDC001215]
ALGYDPQDDSEPYAAALIAEQGELDPSPWAVYTGTAR